MKNNFNDKKRRSSKPAPHPMAGRKGKANEASADTHPRSNQRQKVVKVHRGSSGNRSEKNLAAIGRSLLNECHKQAGIADARREMERDPVKPIVSSIHTDLSGKRRSILYAPAWVVGRVAWPKTYIVARDILPLGSLTTDAQIEGRVANLLRQRDAADDGCVVVVSYWDELNMQYDAIFVPSQEQILFAHNTGTEGDEQTSSVQFMMDVLAYQERKAKLAGVRVLYGGEDLPRTIPRRLVTKSVEPTLPPSGVVVVKPDGSKDEPKGSGTPDQGTSPGGATPVSTVVPDDGPAPADQPPDEESEEGGGGRDKGGDLKKKDDPRQYYPAVHKGTHFGFEVWIGAGKWGLKTVPCPECLGQILLFISSSTKVPMRKEFLCLKLWSVMVERRVLAFLNTIQCTPTFDVHTFGCWEFLLDLLRLRRQHRPCGDASIGLQLGTAAAGRKFATMLPEIFDLCCSKAFVFSGQGTNPHILTDAARYPDATPNALVLAHTVRMDLAMQLARDSNLDNLALYRIMCALKACPNRAEFAKRLFEMRNVVLPHLMSTVLNAYRSTLPE